MNGDIGYPAKLAKIGNNKQKFQSLPEGIPNLIKEHSDVETLAKIHHTSASLSKDRLPWCTNFNSPTKAECQRDTGGRWYRRYDQLGNKGSRCIACRRDAAPAIQAWVSDIMLRIGFGDDIDGVVADLNGQLQLLNNAEDPTPETKPLRNWLTPLQRQVLYSAIKRNEEHMTNVMDWKINEINIATILNEEEVPYPCWTVEQLRTHLVDLSERGQEKTLSEINLSNLYISDVDLPVDLSGFTFKDVILTDTKLMCANLKGANLSGAQLQGADLSGAQLQGADLKGADLQRATLIDTNIQWADLTGADLRHARLYRTVLYGAKLIEANLTAVDLDQARLSGAMLQRADISRATLRNTQLQGTQLQGTQLQGAQLQRANLSGTNLEGANLRDANLDSANLKWAILTGAQFQGADFQGVNLVSAILEVDTLSEDQLQYVDL